jgi:N-hydroxyarylamine O-acetyltransferase
MFDELFAPLYAPIPDVGKYLERIGLDSIQNPDRENLDALVLAHQRNVPFENLDVYDAEIDVSINIPALYDKIVLQHRGGYCFELNAAFMGLLKCLGYDCHAVAARVIWHATCYMPLTHRATIVTIDGVRYFCDVGFGGPSPQRALLLDDSRAQQSGANKFFFEKKDINIMMSRLVNGEKEPLLLFSEIQSDPVDFLALNEYQAKSKNSYFKMARMLNLVTQTGSTTLTGNVFTINSNGSSVEKTLETEADLRQVMKDHFGLEVNYPLNLKS